MPPAMRRARRQNRRRVVAGAAITASAVSSARTNRAVRKNIEAQNEAMENAQQGQPPVEDMNQVAPEEQMPPTQQGQQDDLAAQLEELKGLLDKGLITQEEYDAKKKQLLGL